MKRFFDILISLMILIVSTPFFIPFLLLSLVYFKECPIFKQTRIGLKGNPFKIYKLRTMNFDNGIPLVFKWLRRFGIDELPQLINVFQGDMSIVGPRPLPEEYIHVMNKRELFRHQVKPGITGLAQVMGRNKISWEMKFAYDIKYVKSRSVFFDIIILIRTVSTVFRTNTESPNLIAVRARE